MPIYEYRCQSCGRGSSALLRSWDAADPPCPHCGSRSLGRLVSTFATARSEDAGDSDFGDDFDSGMDGADDGDGGFDDDF
jgi:putative FmdB family regulatory protein